MSDYIFDIETYANVFTLTVEHADLPVVWYFEISDWRNDSTKIIEFMGMIRDHGDRMVGFNLSLIHI